MPTLSDDEPTPNQLDDGDQDIVPLDVLKAEARERLKDDPEADLAMDDDEENCIICLQPVVDRTVLVNCAHDRMCFACIKKWSEQSRRCPLCNTPIGSHLIHRIRSQYDYQKHYLSPLPTSPRPTNIIAEARAAHRARTRRASSIAEERERDELELAIEKRRWVYRHGLFAKHIASNAHTRFRPNPTPQQISNSPELQSRCQMFVRRELRVWPNVDVEFLTSFILSLAKSIDIRTDAAVKLVGEFLDIGGRRSPSGGTTAEHFVHELYSYLRSPFRELPAYDAVVQYDTPDNVEAAPSINRRTYDEARHRDDDDVRRPSTSYDRTKGKAREREMSDPLEASPRDYRADGESDMDMDEDWVEPSKVKGKERMRDYDEERRGNYRSRDSWREREYDRDRGRASGSRYDKGRSQRHRSRSDDRRSRDRGHRDRGGRDRHSGDRGDRSRNDRSTERNKGDWGRDRDRDDRNDDKAYRDKDRHGRRDRTYRHEGRRDRSSSSERAHKSDKYRARADSRERQKRPAGWDNHFEDDRRYRSVSRRSSHSPASRNSRAYDKATRTRSRSGDSPARHQGSAPPSPRSSHALEIDNRIEPKTSDPDFISESTAQSIPAPNPKLPNAPGAESTSHATRKTESRIRPPRLSPLASIRQHLQGVSHPSGVLKAEDEQKTADNAPDKGVARPTAQRNDDPSLATNHTIVASTTLSPSAVENSFTTHAKAPSNGQILDPNPNPSDTHPTRTVSYSILGAAARPKVQPPLITPDDSTQRVPPTSVHSTSLGRTRLLARLEAAKAAGPLATTMTDPASPPPIAPTHPDLPEPVSDTAMQELRLRLAARSRLVRSATNPSGNHPSQNGPGQPEPADPNSPAARIEAERRLKLYARRAVRKRDMGTGSGSSADAR